MSLYPVILPLGERGGVQESWITVDDTVVALNDSTGPGTGGEGQVTIVKENYKLHFP